MNRVPESTRNLIHQQLDIHLHGIHKRIRLREVEITGVRPITGLTRSVRCDRKLNRALSALYNQTVSELLEAVKRVLRETRTKSNQFSSEELFQLLERVVTRS